ncbi:MAG: WG repeat-containing protein [Lachnospiraceae bacterium]|nr:WG repeat-containing protein [Lachnospiraceae bacterium]
MKKRYGIAALLIACSSVSVFAQEAAEDTISFVAEYSDVSWVENSSLLCMETETGCAMADINGNLLTGAIYDDDMTWECGLVIGSVLDKDVNCKGAFAEDGSIVLPFQYGDIEMLSTQWAVGIVLTDGTEASHDYKSWSGDSYWTISTVDVYYLPTKTCVASLPREAYGDAQAMGKNLNIEDRNGVVTAYDSAFNELGSGLRGVWSEDYAAYDYVTYRENGQTGLKDAEGNVVIAPMFQSLYSRYGNYYEAYNGETYGIVDLQGTVRVPAEYEDMDTCYYLPYDPEFDCYGYEAGGYFCVISDGKMGYVDMNGEITCEPKYSESVMENYGASALLNDMEGNVHIISADGLDTVLEPFNSVYAMEYGSGFYYRVTNEDYDYGMVDWHGNYVFECAYNDIEISGDGNYVMVQKEYSDPYQIYELSDLTAQSSSSDPVVEETTEAVEAATTTEAESMAAEADMSAVIDMINSAATLVKVDPATNSAAAVTMLETAVTMMNGSNEAVAKLLESTVTLLQNDAAANSGSILTILEQAVSML